MFSKGDRFKGFVVTKSVEIVEARARLIELTHEESGAEVLHIQADDPENLFCLSFRTLPPSSNGVAHILEHTVLTGSDKFPVKDPFFAMNRRSLNTYLNALTGDDFTCYPAASQVEQDFYNLLDVYLDATFHPLLKKLSFRQEGWRLEYTTPDDPASELEFKGIVYNEMKGSLNSPGARLDDAMSEALFPNSPYGFNAGGRPREIPNLSFEELVQFHKTYYHPSHCLFFFYGDIALEKHLEFIEERVLKGVTKVPKLPSIPKQPRFSAPVRKELFYPAQESEEAQEEKTLISFGWLTTSILNQLEVFALSVLDIILMETDASLLRRDILNTGLCTQATSSLDSENAEVPFTITIRGSKKEHADKLEETIKNSLITIASRGIEERLIEMALHQLELDRTEVGLEGAPFGLMLFGRAALIKQHGGRAEDGMRIHSLFEELRAVLKDDPLYLQNIIRKHFIENTHQVRIVLEPSIELAQKELEQEKEALHAISAALTEKDKKEIIEEALLLMKMQDDESDNEECLPKITLNDVPKKTRHFPLTHTPVGNVDLFFHEAFTNHFVYAELVFPLPALTREELPYARTFAKLLPQLGSGNRNFTQNLDFIQEHTGGISTGFSFNHQINDANLITPTFHIKGKALSRKSDKLFSLLFDTVTRPDLTDKNRIKELLLKYWSQLRDGINSNALQYALSQSAHGQAEPFWLYETWYGLEYYTFLRSIALHYEKESSQFLEKLLAMQDKLLCLEDAHLVITSDATDYSKFLESGFEGLVDLPKKPYSSWKTHFPLINIEPTCKVISSPVAFSAKAFQLGSYSNPESAYLTLAAEIFDNVHLHRKIREQGGAYGGGSSYNPTSGLFYFYSFRDPNIASTEHAFTTAIQLLKEGKFDESDVEEAKLEVLQALDQPVPPSGRAEIAYSRMREGKTEELRQAFRDKLIAATKEDIQKAVEKYIEAGYNRGALVSFASRELAEKENKKLATKLHIEKV